MRKNLKLIVGVLAVAGVWQVSGCGGGLPLIPIPVSLGTLSDFDVQAGTPSQKSFQSSFDTQGIVVARGSVALDPAVMTVEEAQAKTLQVIACGDACSLAGVNADTCAAVCDLGRVQVTVWVGLANELGTVCDTGDEYGPYLVTLDGENNPISVSPPTADLQPKTIQALNAQSASICLEVISPVTGTITIDSITLNAGL